ncbi:MAG: DUF1043 family protein [Pseudomonadota bacterium]
MYELNELIGAVAIALLAGVGVGALLSKRFSVDGRKQRELERNMEKLVEQQQDYQQEVVTHFTDTAKLLNNLAESYRDVHNHLASGASMLCEDTSAPIIRAITDPALEQQPPADERIVASVTPPLDYAPKASADATGVLNEAFGLDKVDVASGGEMPEDFVANQTGGTSDEADATDVAKAAKGNGDGGGTGKEALTAETSR